MPLLETLQKTIAKQRLIDPGETLLVAASGGPDSSALLHALHALGYRVEAAHLHHGIRGEEADQDAGFVQELCEKLAIPCHIGRRDVPALARERKLGIQPAAREARYAFLNETAQESGARLVATGHTCDDRIETVLLNILRGSGVEGLRAIPYRRAIFIRPLLDTWREEVEAYCEEHALSPRRDSSNHSRAYARNNIRAELIPYLERRYNVSVKESLLRLSEIAAAESDYLADTARGWIAARAELPANELNALPLALQRRVLREWIRSRRGDELANIGQETIEALRAALPHAFAITLPGGEWIASGDGALIKLARIEQPEEAPAVAMPVSTPCRLRFFDWEVLIEGESPRADPATLHLRNWRDGDRMRLPGGTRKLQDIFTDSKIPRRDRHTWPIVADKDGPLIVASLAASPRADGLRMAAAKAAQTPPEEGP